MNQSDQLDLVALLSEHTSAAENALTALETALSPQIDANSEDKLLLDMLDYVTDAQESLKAVRDSLQIMEQRDLKEIP
jgi:hypothetical protein